MCKKLIYDRKHFKLLVGRLKEFTVAHRHYKWIEKVNIKSTKVDFPWWHSG